MSFAIKDRTSFFAGAVVATTLLIILVGILIRLHLVHEYCRLLPWIETVFSDILNSVTFLLLVVAVLLAQRNLMGSIMIGLGCAMAVSYGIYIDLIHYPHLSKESAFDGILYFPEHLGILVLLFISVFIYNGSKEREDSGRDFGQDEQDLQDEGELKL